MQSRFLYRLLVLIALALPTLASIACSSSSRSDINAEQSDGRITQIVFVDHQVICPLVKKTINNSWDALQTALASRDRHNIKVTRIHKDKSANLARKYIQLKRTGVLPAVYFLTSKGEFVELLAGEMTADQITAVLDGGRQSTDASHAAHE